MRHRRRALSALTAALLGIFPAGAGAEEAGDQVSVTVTGLRNARGNVLACLTALPAAFPDCSRDAAARKLRVPAAKGTVRLEFGPVPPGTYAISLFHDENGNERLDKLMMMPREGYGFSRDARVMMGPPRFAAAAFKVDRGAVHQTVKMRYIF